jgi:hypothetical protein
MNIQEYLLTCLGEEAAELGQTAGKALRFGLDDIYYPESPREAIIREFNDLVAVLELLNENGVDFKKLHRKDLIEAKRKKLKEFMEYSIKKGILR